MPPPASCSFCGLLLGRGPDLPEDLADVDDATARHGHGLVRLIAIPLAQQAQPRQAGPLGVGERGIQRAEERLIDGADPVLDAIGLLHPRLDGAARRHHP
jgi:hypothetical protein